MAWDGHALAHQPLDFFQSNQFWPLRDTLAFSDALVGYAPAGLIGSGPEAAVFRYDLLFLFAYALAFAGAYLLARELGLGRGGSGGRRGGVRVRALPAGAGRPHAGHLERRASRSPSPSACAATASAGRGGCSRDGSSPPGSCSIGFTLGLPLAYLLVAIWLIAAIVWLRRGRPRLDRGLAIATVAGAAIFVAAGLLLSRPYMRVADAHPGAHRTPADVEAFSGPPWIFLVAPDENLVWGAPPRRFGTGWRTSPRRPCSRAS